MTIVLWILGIVAAAALVLGLIGLALPRTQERRTEEEIGAPRERVRDALRDIEALPRWHPDVDRVERDGSADGTWNVVLTSEMSVKLAVTQADVNDAIVWVFTGAGGAFRGAWQFSMESAGAGTRVVLVHKTRIENPYRRVFGQLSGPKQHLTLMLGSLKRNVEGDAVLSQ